LGSRQFPEKVLPQFFTNGEKIVHMYRLSGHSDKLVLKDGDDVFVSREEHLMNGPIVTGQIRNEAFHNLGRQAAFFVHAKQIEKVPRMLAIKCCHYLAPVELRRG
jgi:hypothetical protein